MGEELADEEGVGRAETAGERVLQGWELLPQLAAGEVGEDRRVGGAGHEGVEHRAAGGAEQTGGDRGARDAGVLQDLVQAVSMASALLSVPVWMRRVARINQVGIKP